MHITACSSLRKSTHWVVSLIQNNLEPLISAENRTLLWGEWEKIQQLPRIEPRVPITKLWPAGNYLPVYWIMSLFPETTQHLMQRAFLTTPNIVLMAHSECLPGVLLKYLAPPVQYMETIVRVGDCPGSQFTSQSTGSMKPEFDYQWLPAFHFLFLHVCFAYQTYSLQHHNYKPGTYFNGLNC